MIKFLPTICPNEAAYSFLSRCYSRSGYIWNSGFANEIFERPTASIDCSFLNIFTQGFKELIEERIGFERFLLDHTLFKYYSRFLPLKRRRKVLDIALGNSEYIDQLLPIPLKTNTSSLRYCPICVNEDRIKYGEAYIHVTHTIPEITICPTHRCKLIDIEFIATKINNASFVPLEHAITDMDPDMVNEDNINLKLAAYITEVFNEPLNIAKELIIGNFLSNKLESKYISPRGEQRYIGKLWEDIQKYYYGLDNFSITKGRLVSVYRNNSFNPYDILLLSMFQNIAPHDLATYTGSSKPKYLAFDNKVKGLYRSGESINKISKIMNVNHEVVRQILLGTYDKPRGLCSPYRCQKWDWAKIDKDCCEIFYDKIKEVDIKSISKAVVAELFNLKDNSLRNLPRLNAMIQSYKKSS